MTIQEELRTFKKTDRSLTRTYKKLRKRFFTVKEKISKESNIGITQLYQMRDELNDIVKQINAIVEIKDEMSRYLDVLEERYIYKKQRKRRVE